MILIPICRHGWLPQIFTGITERNNFTLGKHRWLAFSNKFLCINRALDFLAQSNNDHVKIKKTLSFEVKRGTTAI